MLDTLDIRIPRRHLQGTVFVTVIALLAVSCARPTGDLGSGSTPARADTARFVEVAQEVGLVFQYFNGMSGEYYLPEIKSGGGGLLDYDNDGDLDVYLTQGHMLGPGKTINDALFPPPPGSLTDRLFRNDLSVGSDGARVLKFVDVTNSCGIVGPEYGLGVAAGDYDNDGWTDLYVSSTTRNRMWHNNGDGTFTDLTGRTGTDDPKYSTSCAFLDFDRDGWLDLFVANYVDFSFKTHKPCYEAQGNREYCGPQSYDALPDSLFRNRGDGTFENVSVSSRMATAYGSGLGVVTADFDGNGWIDLYVANDNLPNHLWLNQGDGTFRETATFAGCALSADGLSESSMGVDCGDFDADGDEDLFMTHLLQQTNTLYVNEGNGWFSDRSLVTGLGSASYAFTSFGTGWFDFDNDGWLDLLTASGGVAAVESRARTGDVFPYDQQNQLFRNLGDGTFEDLTDLAGPAFELVETSRGAVFGDIDNDGDTDVMITNIDAPTRLLLNQFGNTAHWLGVRLMTGDGVRVHYGAWAALLRERQPTLWRRARAEASYCATNDPRILFGLGEYASPVTLDVYWPDGQLERWVDLETDRYVTIRQGTGETPR